MTKNASVSSLSQLIGKNYKQFWDFRGRYRVVKGGRGSKKSTTQAMWLIYHLLKYPKANALCMRRYYNSLRDSCFAELKKAANRLGVGDKFKFTINPLEITVKHTGQKILFRGFDNPDSVTSITVAEGVLCWVWIEEAYQIESEEDFNKLDFSIRGRDIDEFGLFPQITLTLNPWCEMWIKDRFFDVRDDNILAITRNYYHNEFLSERDYKQFADLERDYPERYKVEGLGEWGIPGGTYFSEWRESIHICEPFELPDEWRRYVSFDYGLDMFACYFYAISPEGKVFAYKEIYESGLIISEAINRLKEFTNEEIYEYFAPPDMWNKRQETGKSVSDWFAEAGIFLEKATNDRVQGWLNIKEYLKPYEAEDGKTANLIVFRNCINLIRCLPRLTMDEKNPNDAAKEPHEITHAPDALRYFIAGRPSPARAKEKKPLIQFASERKSYIEQGDAI